MWIHYMWDVKGGAPKAIKALLKTDPELIDAPALWAYGDKCYAAWTWPLHRQELNALFTRRSVPFLAINTPDKSVILPPRKPSV